MSYVQDPKCKDGIQEMFAVMENKSGDVDFSGFMLQVATLAIICKTGIDEMPKCNQ